MLPRKYHLKTSDNLSSKLFLVTNTDNLSENCQLLRDIDFSVVANENDIVSLSLFDNDKKLICFEYITNKDKPVQNFKNNGINLNISFTYQKISDKHNTYMLCCPDFILIKHPDKWSSDTHYGVCGQSCPCCRASVGESFGACPICLK